MISENLHEFMEWSMNMYVTKSTTSILLSGFVGWTLPVKDLHVFLLKFLNMCVMWWLVSFQNVCMSHSSPVIFNLLLHVIPQQKIEWTLDWILCYNPNKYLLGLKKVHHQWIVKYFLSAKMQHVGLKFRKIHSPYFKDASLKKRLVMLKENS